LGQRVVVALLERGGRVVCLVRRSANLEPLRRLAEQHTGRLDFVWGTLAQPASYADSLEGCACVYHVAAAMKGGTAVLFQNNVVATSELVKAAGRCGVGRFVLISSLAVYGSQSLPTGGVLDETCTLDPQPHLRDPYTYSKHSQEAAVQTACFDARLPIVVVRPGVIYGPGRDCITSRVGLQIGGLLICMGGRQELPYTHVDNCAEAIALAGLTARIEGEAFNIVDDNPPTARQLLRRYRREVARVRTVRIPHIGIMPLSRMCQWYNAYSRGQLPAVLTPYKSAAMWKVIRYSNAKAKRMLSWQPRINFDQGLEATFSALREQNLAHKISA